MEIMINHKRMYQKSAKFVMTMSFVLSIARCYYAVK